MTQTPCVAHTFADGMMHPGEAPGLGVDIDETLAAQYPYRRAYLPINRVKRKTARITPCCRGCISHELQGARRIPLGASAEGAHAVMNRILAAICWMGLVTVAGSSAPAAPPRQKTDQVQATPAQVSAADLDREIRQFLEREITAHVEDIKTLDPPPDRVVGALTTGEFSWGTFMRALAAYAELSGARAIAGRDIPTLIGKIGLIESRQSGKAFAQLYAALALRHFGTDLNRNPVWQSLSPEEKQAWRSLLDPGRFYDRQSRRVINLPENYLGVASRIAAISYQLGIITGRAYVDDILDRAAQQFTSGALYADDAIPTGRYDRYSQEYARYIYDAAETSDRKDILKAMEPTLKVQMQLWWDLLSPDGYGYPWGRSLGAIGYMDTVEIVAFLARHPQFRPAPMSQLATAYYVAWRWLRRDFQDNKHVLSVFAFGRGNYSYINKEREWQQTSGFFGKLTGAHLAFAKVLAEENIISFAAQLHLPNIARFEFFRRNPTRQFGVWVVRHGQMRFALPFTTGPKAGVTDYLPAPHGVPGFAVPVEQVYPCLVPFLELQDGTVIVASDGADAIQPSENGHSVTATWKRWAVAGRKAGATIDPGIRASVAWQVNGNHLRRTETLVSSKPLRLRRWWVAIPSTADYVLTNVEKGSRVDRFESREGTLEFRVLRSDWTIESQLTATGDSALGRGARGPIPLILVLTAPGFALDPSRPLKWEVDLRAVAPPDETPSGAGGP